jgi:hypothetical protein
MPENHDRAQMRIIGLEEHYSIPSLLTADYSFPSLIKATGKDITNLIQAGSSPGVRTS